MMIKWSFQKLNNIKKKRMFNLAFCDNNNNNNNVFNQLILMLTFDFKFYIRFR